MLNDRLENYKFLYRYIPEPTHILDRYEISKRMIDFIKTKTTTTPQEIIESLGKSLEEKAKIITLIWHLLANGIIEANLDKPLTNSSLLSLNQNKGENLKALFFMINTA